MKKRMRSIIAKIFAFVMVFEMAFPMTAEAASLQGVGDVATLSGNAYLGQEIAMITEDGKAVQIDAGTVKANGTVEVVEGGVKVSDSANFTITKHSTEDFYAVNNTKQNQFLQLTGFDWNSNLTVTAGNGQWNAESLNQPAWEGFVVEEAAAGQYLLTTTVRFNSPDGQVQVYAKVGSDSVLATTTDSSEATSFYFASVQGVVEDEETTEPGEVTGVPYLGEEIAIVTADGKAVKVCDENELVKVDGAVENVDGGVKTTAESVFVISGSTAAEGVYAINNSKVEGGKFLLIVSDRVFYRNGSFANPGSGAWEAFCVEQDATDTDAYYLTTASWCNPAAYATVNAAGELKCTTDKSAATKFYFKPVKEVIADLGGSDIDPEPETPVNPADPATLFPANSAFAIEHVATGKLVKTYATAETALTVDGVEGDEGTVFSKAVVGINNNTLENGNNANLTVVSLVSKDYNNGAASVLWNPSESTVASGASATVVKAHGSIAGTGWESVQVVANSDGTVSFKDSYFNQYITVAEVDGVATLKCMSDVAEATDNEKFRIVAVAGSTEPEVPVSTEFTIENVATGKLVKTYATAGTALTVDGEEGDAGTVFSNVVFGTNDNNITASIISKDYNKGVVTAYWDGYAAMDYLKVHDSMNGNGWESVQIVANGDGTVSFKDSVYSQYILVVDVNGVPTLKCWSDVTKETLTDNDKYIIHSSIKPAKVENLAVTSETRTQTTLDLTWSKPASIYTNVQVYQKGPDDSEYIKIANLADETTYQATNLKAGAEYSFKLVVVNGNGDPDDTTYSTESNVVTAQTRAGVKPATPVGVKLEEKDDKFVISWDAAENATHYQVIRAESMFGTYEVAATTKDTSVELAYSGNKYANYYRVVALNNGEAGDVDFSGAEVSEESTYVSLETNMFGDHTLIFAPTDDVAKIDETLQKLFDETHDGSADAQFKGEHWQVYFKPGDYTETSCIYLGFYTSINGLGQTPYDVRLNNVAIPAYLADNNATCNFWRSMENVSIINTGNAQGTAQYGSWRANDFNWGVAQAAPLRRVYSERPVSYDWNYGWASGGYVADCYFTQGAGTWSGQQFYTRNSKIAGDAFGTTLNNFFQGVEASNLPNAAGVENGTATALLNGNGYSNWSIPAADGAQQVFTNVETTPEIAEKPFLYIDENGEYKVFVPAMREDSKGISWSEDDMGEGTSLSLDTFYIAKPSDSAATINAQLAAGKNIYFTPGIYHAEETIMVNNSDTIILGTGLATIVADNADAAMRIADVDGVKVAGIVFDAGEHSKFLLVVGEDGSDKDHSSNPTILQDLFFRVGGTTDVLTKADDALVINSNDVIGDHFWIWRADHGAGVEWYGNESKHGLIVNGDDVTCYALFNEHFQEYHTLWNGENGATYFYQNETAYDPISQEAWMSHDGTVNGYSSYKVADDVENHYAVGLGIYNVFIYTGPTYDATEVQIQLDNAIEVPDAPGVLVENACLQTFAKDDGVLQKINTIVNGMGDFVSSGKDPVTGEVGLGWNRTFLSYYCNGEAYGSSRDVNAAESTLQEAYNTYSAKLDSITDEAQKAKLQAALDNAEAVLDEIGQYVTWSIEDEITAIEAALSDLKEAAVEAGVLTGEEAEAVKQEKEAAKNALEEALAAAADLVEADYTSDSWEDCQEVVSTAEAVYADENATTSEIKAATKDLQNAMAGLENAPVIPEEPVNPEEPVKPEEPATPETPVNPEEPATPETPVTPEEPEKTEKPSESKDDKDSSDQSSSSNQESSSEQTATSTQTAPVVVTTPDAPASREDADEPVVDSVVEEEATDVEVTEDAEESADEIVIEEDEVAKAPGIGAVSDVAGESNSWNIWWIIVIGAVVITAVGVFFVVVKKKEDDIA